MCQLKFPVVVVEVAAVAVALVLVLWMCGCVHEFDYSHLVLTLGMNGGILLLPHMLSCHGQEELCFMFMTDFMKFAIIQ